MRDWVWVDFKQALRVFARSPGYAASVVLSLAAGIGGATSIFALVSGLLLRPLPGIVDQDRLVAVMTSESGGSFGVSAYMDFLDFRDGSNSLESLSAFKPRIADVSTDGAPEAVPAAMVSANYFATLGVRPLVGRFFEGDADVEPGTPAEAVITHGYWQRTLGGSLSVLGRTMQINGRAFQLIGVTPPDFQGTTLSEKPQLFVPISMQPVLMPESGYLLDRRGWGGIFIVARLAPGVSRPAALEEIQVLGERLANQYPDTNGRRAYDVVPVQDAVVPGVPRHQLALAGGLLLAVVGVLWLVVCLNVANLFMVRALRRRQELAVRQALGAGRRRVASTLVMEFMILAVAAGTTGVFLARGISGVVARVPSPIDLNVGLDLSTAAFAGLVTLASGVICALLPALSPAVTGKAAESISTALRPLPRRWPNRILVVGQVALSVILLFGTGLFVQTLVNLTSTGPGFDPRGILTAEFHPGLQGYETAQVGDFYDRLTARISGLPGVDGVALADALPAVGALGSDTWFVEGAEDPERPSSLSFSTVSANFFETIGVPVLDGRGFAADDVPGQPPVLIINEAAARLIEARTGRSALAAALALSGPEGPFLEVVGVVGDTRAGRGAGASPTLYGLHPQVLALGFGGARMTMIVRATVPPASLTDQIREVAAEVDPNVAASNLLTMEEALDQVFGPDRMAVTVLGASSALALLLVALGLYGLLSMLVAQRTRDFGIRVALGAGRGKLTEIVLREALLLSATGLALGTVAGPLLLRLASTFLVGVSPSDPASVLLGSGVVLAVALLAAWVPARRAMNSDPLEAMRA